MRRLDGHLLRLNAAGAPEAREDKAMLEFEVDEIMASLAGLAIGPYFLSRWTWSNEDVLSQLHLLLTKEVMLWAKDQKWHCMNNHQQLSRLAMAALISFRNNHRCTTCNGTGVVCNKKQANTFCDNCNAKGRAPISRQKMADICGIAYDSFGKSWQSKLSDAVGILIEWSESVSLHMEKKLTFH